MDGVLEHEIFSRARQHEETEVRVGWDRRPSQSSAEPRNRSKPSLSASLRTIRAAVASDLELNKPRIDKNTGVRRQAVVGTFSDSLRAIGLVRRERHSESTRSTVAMARPSTRGGVKVSTTTIVRDRPQSLGDSSVVELVVRPSPIPLRVS